MAHVTLIHRVLENTPQAVDGAGGEPPPQPRSPEEAALIVVTLGSPLDKIQDKAQPEWSRAAGFPGEKVAAGCVYVYDRPDPVCGFDPELTNDFRKSGAQAVGDIAVQNEGAWRYSIGKYLRQSSLCNALLGMLR
jgi:hypothetical protein